MLLKKILHYYNEIENLADSRVQKWFLMNSFLVPIIIVMFYLYFVLKLGPKIMKNRKAFHINRLILFYNIIQVIFNAYLFVKVFLYVVKHLHTFRCYKVDFSDTEEAYDIRTVNWLFTVNKLMDLLDTVFFVLKKKQSHITFLHVYHHIMTFTMCWALSKYYPGGQLVVIGTLNSFVHCVMYAYYLFSLVDGMKKITFFMKKRITQMQILQFVLALIHAVYSVSDRTCDYPLFLMYFGFSQGILMIILFANFYRNAYLKNARMKAQNQSANKMK